MSTITRRSLILSGAGLATAAFVVPAEAATGSVSLHIASAGFIFGVTGGSGTLTFRGQQFPLQSWRHQRGRLGRRLGDGSRRHRVEHSRSGRHRGPLLGHRRRLVHSGGQKHRATVQRQRRRPSPSRASGRLQLLDRSQRNEHLAGLSQRVFASRWTCAGESLRRLCSAGRLRSASPGGRTRKAIPCPLGTRGRPRTRSSNSSTRRPTPRAPASCRSPSASRPSTRTARSGSSIRSIRSSSIASIACRRW